MQEAQNSVLPADLIDATARELGLTMTVQFVPWSQSRNKAEKHPSLNWIVTLHKTTPGNGHDQPAYTRAILTTDYGAGCGHCPAYKASVKTLGHKNSILRDGYIRWECEHGKEARLDYPVGTARSAKSLQPHMRDVLYSLASDSSVLDESSFEDWAASLGYDADSRSAEKTYRACLDIALKLRSALGDAGLEKLRAACQDY